MSELARTRDDFEAFWRSAEYAPLKRLRHECCGSRILVFDARAPGV